ncbi:MAG: hypothetical protein CMA13_01695 [Euryarchaeota archaeon]|nr:hypothetical protein [Euryarchaeota archaeon]OUV26075.1 MAG: hypothetical protein CBC57_03090 [Euryarchaeota archaeon TMED97]
MLNLYPTDFYYEIKSSYTIIRGKDGIKHLERVLTTKIENIEFGNKHESLLCDLNGRVIDLLTIYIIKNELLIVGNSIKGDEVRRILSTGIPWNEDIIVLNADESIRKVILSGDKINRIFKNIYDSILELKDFDWLESGDNIISTNNRHKITSIEILMPKNEMNIIKKKLIENKFKMINEKEWNKFRIDVGIINHKEIDNRIPFNVGMKELVKMDKGCYPGQEIHARLESRGKLTKTLVRLSCQNFLKEGEYKIDGGGKIIITTAYDGKENKSKFLGIIPIKYVEMDKIVLTNGIEMVIEDVVSFQSLNFHR